LYFPNRHSSHSSRYKPFHKTLPHTTNTQLHPRHLTLPHLNPILLLQNHLTTPQTPLPIPLIPSTSPHFQIILHQSYIPPSLPTQKQHHLNP
ncbi:type VI secretion system baseplate subunit TssK, partial [Neisseria sicca]|uniref:type VI secretion system baseplate subunit TssK n=1 Tax=Neisseria sicca TaxID=490 RepID=UPI001649863C